MTDFKQTAFRQTVNAFQRTIFNVDKPLMKEFCDPVELVQSEDTQEVVSRFKIRLASNSGRREAARMLVQKMYSSRGYDTSDVAKPVEVDPTNQLTMLVSDADEHPLATMSVIFDRGTGLPADEIYQDLLDPFRKEGRRLAEVSRLAIDRTDASKQLFSGLIHVAMIYMTAIHRYTDWIIEVSPRHVVYYQKILKFDVVSEVRHCTRVNSPAVLLRIKMEDMLAYAKAMGGKGRNDKGEKSLYPYFFSSQDALGIVQRLLAKE